jgi:hypothetical protein
MVDDTNETILYGSLSYETYIWLIHNRLKKSHLPCRYCFGQVNLKTGFIEGKLRMDKRELINYICKINRTAKPEFLSTFTEEQLNAYLDHLMELDLEEVAVCNG